MKGDANFGFSHDVLRGALGDEAVTMSTPDPGSPSRRGPGASPLAVVVVVALLLLLAAISTPEAFVWLRHVGVTRVVLPDTPFVANYLLVAISIAFLIAGLILRLMMVSRRRLSLRPQRAPWWARLFGFACMLLLLRFALSSELLRRRLGELGRRFVRPAPTPTSTSAHGALGPHLTSRPLGIALTVVLGLVLASAIAGIVFLLARVKGEIVPSVPDDPLDEMLEAGIEDLRRIGDPRRAVIACYARMERLMISSGIPRLPTDTPTEFLTRILERRSISSPSVARLTDLFERAKFSPHRIDEKMRQDALSALEQVRGELVLA